MLRRPLLALGLVLSLALGLGFATTIGTLVQSTLEGSLPYPNAGLLMLLWEQEPTATGEGRVASLPNFQDWQQRLRSFEQLTATFMWQPTWQSTREPLKLSGLLVTDDFFEVLDIKASMGRLLGSPDHKSGAPPAAVVSYSFWQRQLGGEPEAVGKSLTLDGEAITVVGVLPASFSLGTPVSEQRVDVIAVLPLNLPWFLRGNRMLRVLGRLRPAVNEQQAMAELAAVSEALAREHPADNEAWRGRAASLHDLTVAPVRPALLWLLAASALVLLLACVNVAGLLTVDLERRRQELALRAAFGAGRGRLLRQLVVENLPWLLASALLGWWLASLALDILPRFLPAQVAWLVQLRPRGATFAFVLGLTLLATFLLHLLPYGRLSPLRRTTLLRPGARDGLPPALRGIYTGIMVVEVALGTALCLGAVLLVSHFARLASTPLGFEPDAVLTLQMELPRRQLTEAQRLQFLDALPAQLEQDARILHAAVVSHLPLTGALFQVKGSRVGEKAPDEHSSDRIALRGISPGYLSTLEIHLLQGRGFEVRTSPAGSDGHVTATEVVLLNETAVRQLGLDLKPGSQLVGSQVQFNWADKAPKRVIGIVADTRPGGPTAPAIAEAYLPFSALPHLRMTLVARTRVPPSVLADEVRRRVRALNPYLLLSDAVPLQHYLDTGLQRQRLLAGLSSLFAAVGLCLALFSVVTVTAAAAQRRHFDHAVRLALGAQPGDLLRQALWQSGRGIAAALLVGVGLALLLDSYLQGTTPLAPDLKSWQLIAVPLLLGVLALLTIYRVTRGAVDLDPAQTLRQP